MLSFAAKAAAGDKGKFLQQALRIKAGFTASPGVSEFTKNSLWNGFAGEFAEETIQHTAEWLSSELGLATGLDVFDLGVRSPFMSREEMKITALVLAATGGGFTGLRGAANLKRIAQQDSALGKEMKEQFGDSVKASDTQIRALSADIRNSDDVEESREKVAEFVDERKSKQTEDISKIAQLFADNGVAVTADEAERILDERNEAAPDPDAVMASLTGNMLGKRMEQGLFVNDLIQKGVDPDKAIEIARSPTVEERDETASLAVKDAEDRLDREQKDLVNPTTEIDQKTRIEADIEVWHNKEDQAIEEEEQEELRGFDEFALGVVNEKDQERTQAQAQEGRVAPLDLSLSTSPRDTVKGLTSANVEAIAKRVVSKQAVPPNNLIVVDTIDQLPPAAREFAQERAEEGLRVRAMYQTDTDSVYLVSSNLRDPDEVSFVATHELVGHRGIDAVLGKEVEPFFKDLLLARRKDIKEYADERNIPLNTPSGRRLAAREWMADSVALGHFDKAKVWWKRLIAMFKKALAKISGARFTNEQLADIVSAAMFARPATATAGLAFSTSEDKGVAEKAILKRIDKLLNEIDPTFGEAAKITRPVVVDIERLKAKRKETKAKQRAVKAEKKAALKSVKRKHKKITGEVPEAKTPAGVVSEAFRKGTKDQKTRDKQIERFKKEHKKLTGKPTEAKTIPSVMRSTFNEGKKAGRELQFVKGVNAAIDQALKEIQAINAGRPDNLRTSMDEFDFMITHLEEILDGPGTEKEKTKKARADMNEWIGEENRLAIRRATRGDIAKSLVHARKRLNTLENRYWKADLRRWLTKTVPEKMFNGSAENGTDFGDQAKKLIRDYKGIQGTLSRLREEKNNRRRLVKNKAPHAEVEASEKKIAELKNDVEARLEKANWKDNRTLALELSALFKMSTLMQQKLSDKNKTQKGDAAGQLNKDLTSTLPVLKKSINETQKTRGWFQSLFGDGRGDENTMALVMGGGKIDTVGYSVFYESLRRANIDSLTSVADIHRDFQDLLKDNNVTNKQMGLWIVKLKKHNIDGRVLEFTDAEIMELYALMLDPQARLHLRSYGFKAERKRIQNEPGVDKFGFEDIGPLINTLSSSQKKIVEEMRSLKNALVPEANLASLSVFGRERFFNEDHWVMTPDTSDTPPQKSEDFRGKDYNQVASLMNPNFTKNRVPHKHVLMLGDVFDRFQKQVYDMATWTHMLVPGSDAISLLNDPKVKETMAKTLGTKFAQNMVDNVLALAGVTKHSDKWTDIDKFLQAIQRRTSPAILGSRLSTVLMNRGPGSVLLANELRKLGISTFATGKLAIPTRFFADKKNEAIRQKLLKQGYFYHRWVMDELRVMSNLPVDVKASKSLAQLAMRRWQSKALQGMSIAEQRNAVAAYKLLKDQGRSEVETIDILDEIIRKTQDPATALEETVQYRTLKSTGFGIFLPFFGQPSVAANIWYKDWLKWKYNKTPENAKNLMGTALTAVANGFASSLIRKGFRMARTGAASVLIVKLAAALGSKWKPDPDDVKELEKENTFLDWYAGFGDYDVMNFLSEFPSSFVPWAGKLSRVILGAAKKINDVEWSDKSVGEAAVEGTEAFAEVLFGFSEEIHESLVGSTINKLGFGAKDLAKGLSNADHGQTLRGVFELVEGSSNIVGAPLGGVIQKIESGLGLIGAPARKKAKVNAAKRTRRKTRGRGRVRSRTRR